MTINPTDIQIVEYEPRYAASIADMWNASHESWGGDNAIQTEQMILKEHHNSVHLNVFLAVNQDEVIGYCSFSHYKEDAGALYIALLNVRPDYHGQKIGKRLVLRAVEETITLGWPRVDLYTWPGNVKAVPAYKKAGFFWERRDDVTHLINLIPSVLQTPAVQSYFDQIDWYNDSVREIATQPDGEGENGFDYFVYEWRKDDLHLRMEYERTGRGLRLIETDDYLISATIPKQHRLPFGMSYPIQYEIVNKTGKPLQVDINASGNEQVDYELHQSVTVQQRETIQGSFVLKPIEQEQNPFQTHPVVEAELLINGLAAVFKLGVEPKFPVRLKLQPPHRTLYVGDQVELELSVENEYDTEETYRIRWPQHALLSFVEPELLITVPAQSRRSVMVTAQVLQYGIWHERITIDKANGDAMIHVLDQYVSLVLPHVQSAFGGETEKEWVAVNGLCHVHLNKESNSLNVYYGSEQGTVLFYPKFGLPYNDAFQKNRPVRVSFRQEDHMIMEVEYELESQQLQFTTVITLQRNGIVTRHHIVRNQMNEQRIEPLFLKEKFAISLHDSVIPYRGEFIHTSSGPDASSSDYWLVEDWSENWVFTQKDHSAWGTSWPQHLPLQRDLWHYALEHPLGVLQSGEVVTTSAITLAGGTWSRWQDFRSFAIAEGTKESLSTLPPLELVFNNGNPFVHGVAAPIQLIEHKNAVLDGKMLVESQQAQNHSHTSNDGNMSIQPQQFHMPLEEQLRQYNGSWSLESQRSGEVDVLNIHLDMDSYELKQQRLLIPVADHSVNMQIITDEHGEVHSVNNGILEFKASEAFAPTIFSLQYKGQEWLDSSYPQPGPKSWWNPWLGGLSLQIGEMSQASMLEETHTCSFTEMLDTNGNRWSGIAIDTAIRKNAKFKGLSLRQYYLTLPGVPLVASVVRVDQQTGTSLTPLNVRYWNYYKPGEDMASGKLHVRNTVGEELVYKAGKVEYDVRVLSGTARLSSSERNHHLYAISVPQDEECWGFVDAGNMLTAADNLLYLHHGQTVLTRPQFHLFTSIELADEALNDLRRIRFVSEEPTS
ncbi:GNAT family N-acetyltransferase [Paenibacillus kandeliae]|uniref:GNAT family N-acetyltransferase n=1 Tax=Paenibacillus kandeliae TaxID=3231269 RepID=UPI0034587A1F